MDRALLAHNLGGDEALAATAIGALVEAAATAAPRGKQNSFAAHGRAGYVLVERGDRQPRTLAGAFARPVGEIREEAADIMASSISRLRSFRASLDKAYGTAAEASAEMEVGGEGTLAEILAFARG